MGRLGRGQIEKMGEEEVKEVEVVRVVGIGEVKGRGGGHHPKKNKNNRKSLENP